LVLGGLGGDGGLRGGGLLEALGEQGLEPGELFEFVGFGLFG
jgi:hypothetical protein